ncbi:MAG TPA: N-6 DNA methylase [Thermoanaerobaculia bacterium]|nr:N-6 DNA methylase [Thermoanaerobaculia bacterium]
MRAAAGSERKTTGSYYTPTSLIECLLDSALDPVLDEAEKAADPEKALLALKVCDPACGSGHFLIAAAHRMARRLASVRTGEDEPDPSATRTALRDVIGRCLYGVDLNPMAAELCRVALWIEALEPGKPLSFLDHHVQVGNSLLGTTPALLAKGIPDEAFTPIEGDEKAACSAWKKRNKAERQQMGLAEAAPEPWEAVRHLAVERAGLDATPDASPDGVRAKEERWRKLLASDDYTRSRLLADAWCAAFVWKKTSDPAAPPPVTEETFRRLAASPVAVPEAVRNEIVRLREQYQFFHWHLAFPEVFRVPAKGERPESEATGWSGGFDVVLGNPPWERVQFEERTFFMNRDPRIGLERSQSRRRAMIAALRETAPGLHDEWHAERRRSEGEAHLLRHAGRFPRAGVDRFNLYALFAELVSQSIRPRGCAGIIVPAGIISDELCASLFAGLHRDGRLRAAFEFENRDNLFPTVHSSYRFVLLTIGQNNRPTDFCFGRYHPNDVDEESAHIALTADDVQKLSPNTGTCPRFRSGRDLRIARAAHNRFPPLRRHEPAENPWDLSIDRYINVSDFSDEIVGLREIGPDVPTLFEERQPMTPIYEGKLLHQFDHRFASYDCLNPEAGAPMLVNDKHAVTVAVCSRFLPAETALRRNPALRSTAGLVAVRDICRNTDERTVIAAITPPVITDYTIRVFALSDPQPSALLLLVAILNSFALDFLARLRVGGTHLSNYILDELPIPRPADIPAAVTTVLLPCALELVFTSKALRPLVSPICQRSEPYPWNEERRRHIRCELDAAIFHLYGIPRTDVDYIMDTFPIVRRNDEQKHGDYRTKNLVLEIYDELQRAIDTGKPFVSRLDPPPADSRAAHGPP